MAEFVFERDDAPTTRIKVIGVGGGGCNAIDSMVEEGLHGVEFYSVNTDAQALESLCCPNTIQIGREVTRGMGAGGDPVIGEQAAVGDRDLLTSMVEGADMVFLTSCLGGGTGTGATPVIAELAKSLGILTVGFVTKPFQFEGPQRKLRAQQGIDRLRDYVDALIVVMNDKLLESVGQKTSLLESFAMVNGILAQGVRSISDLISMPGLVNADFQDVRSVMGETGGAVLGVGIGKGENRAAEAVKKACSATLQEKIVIDGARRVLVSLTGGEDMTLHEVNDAASLVYEAADPDANIIFSAVIDERLSDEIRVTIIATGFGEELAKLSATPLGPQERTPTLRPAPKAPAPKKQRAIVESEFDEPVRRKERNPVRAEFEEDHSDIEEETVEREPVREEPEAAPEDLSVPERTQPAPPELSSWNDEPEEKQPEPVFAPHIEDVRAKLDSLEEGDEEAQTSLEIPTIVRRRKSFFN